MKIEARIYRSDKGIWHCETDRHDGRGLRWFSLHTRDESEAKRKLERLLADFERAFERVAQPCGHRGREG